MNFSDRISEISLAGKEMSAQSKRTAQINTDKIVVTSKSKTFKILIPITFLSTTVYEHRRYDRRRQKLSAFNHLKNI